MSEKYRFYEGGLFFVTMTVVGWIDVFTRRDYADVIVDSLNFCIEKKGLKVYSFCLMPSHLHLICSAGEGNVSPVLRDFKSFTAKQILHLIEMNPQESRKEWLLYLFKIYCTDKKHNSAYQFWQKSNHPIDLTTAALLQQKQQYIHQNPVQAGLVTEPQYYTYSSANWEGGVQLAEL